MTISRKGLALIKKYEGFRNHPYKCPAGVATIGYGTTFYPNGVKVSLYDAPISREQAEGYLMKVVSTFERDVKNAVKVKLTQEQFDALVSFTYNVGIGALRSSTLLKKVNRNPNDPSIADEFKKWVFAGGIELKGLKKRRNEESYLYFNEARKEKQEIR